MGFINQFLFFLLYPSPTPNTHTVHFLILTFSKVNKSFSKSLFPHLQQLASITRTPNPLTLCSLGSPESHSWVWLGGGDQWSLPGLEQLLHANSVCTGVNWSVLVLGACCQRGSGTVSKFSQMPGPWLKASAVGEGKLAALEDWTGEDPAGSESFTVRMCNGKEKSKMWCYVGPNCISKALFPFHSKTDFPKQVLFDQLEHSNSFWGKPHSFLKIGLFESPTARSWCFVF